MEKRVYHFNPTLLTRNMPNTGRGKYELTEVDEELIKQANQIPTMTTLKENEEGSMRGWYGNRLTMLRDFYHKTNKEISISLGYSDTYIAAWMKNSDHPSEKALEKICFYFEVPKEFFTKREITIKMTEQLKLSLCVD